MPCACILAEMPIEQIICNQHFEIMFKWWNFTKLHVLNFNHLFFTVFCIIEKMNTQCFAGGGYEPEAHYPQWRRIHQSIERRHAFHDSLIKMIEGIFSNVF